jgi:uncharacterized protein (TIGR03083 family)
MDTAALYHETRQRLLGLGAELADDERSAPVPALPGWSVRDTYAHLAGVCADALDGNLEGVATPPWTAAQLAARADKSFDELTAEWTERGPTFDVALQSLTGPRSIMAAVDVWSHEQDIRGAVGLRGERSDDRVRFLVEQSLVAFDGRFAELGIALEVVVDGEPATLGRGTASATWSTTGYELLRTFTGRRSLAQIGAADWDGDPSPYLDHLHLFDLPERDLSD